MFYRFAVDFNLILANTLPALWQTSACRARPPFDLWRTNLGFHWAARSTDERFSVKITSECLRIRKSTMECTTFSFFIFHDSDVISSIGGQWIFWPLVKPLGLRWEHSWSGEQRDRTTLLKNFVKQCIVTLQCEWHNNETNKAYLLPLEWTSEAEGAWRCLWTSLSFLETALPLTGVSVTDRSKAPPPVELTLRVSV